MADDKSAGYVVNRLIVGVIAVVIIGAVVGGMLWQRKHKAMPTATNTASSSSSIPLAGNATPPTSSKADIKSASQGQIPELGVQLTLPDSIKDLQYVYFSGSGTDPSAPYPGVFLSTDSLAKLDPECAASTTHSSLGVFFKVPGDYPANPSVDNTPGALVKQFSDYYIAYRRPQAACSDNTEARDLQTSQTAVVNQALTSLDAIPQ